MREIKFRAWDKIKKKMYEAYSVTNGEMCVDINFTNECENGSRIDLEWMQFTGLHDKNGKEIYEGDLMRNFDNSISLVEYKEIEASDDATAPGVGFQFSQEPFNIEVIGNIYENPELLNQEE
jgi:uncharacterized phage protein (TIGR01671 family)